MNSAEKLKLAMETIEFPVYYDSDGQSVRDANGMMVCDIRGWSKIQFMTQSEDRQDAIGALIANLLNQSGRNFNGSEVLKSIAS
ncbi:hypothetical protein [Salegentibacter chungangensis]|uniref:Uncharacterized protein n=1 Tax=Salegentibacter chungangensis TaxID=1335724 RepID=A0ABW3NVT1_9FLAO